MIKNKKIKKCFYSNVSINLHLTISLSTLIWTRISIALKSKNSVLQKGFQAKGCISVPYSFLSTTLVSLPFNPSSNFFFAINQRNRNPFLPFFCAINRITCVNNKVLEYDWLLTALICGCFRPKLSDYKCNQIRQLSSH